jgi:hypothetical protein
MDFINKLAQQAGQSGQQNQQQGGQQGEGYNQQGQQQQQSAQQGQGYNQQGGQNQQAGGFGAAGGLGAFGALNSGLDKFGKNLQNFGGPGGIGEQMNTAAGGGRESEKNEDYLDKGISHKVQLIPEIERNADLFV